MTDREELTRCRAFFRHDLMPRAVYSRHAGAGAAPGAGLPGEALAAVTLLKDRHFRPGATHWRDLQQTPAELAACFLNAAAHQGGTKPPPEPKPRRGAAAERYRVQVTVETLLSEPTQQGMREVVGYRLWTGYRPHLAPAPPAAAAAAAGEEPTADEAAAAPAGTATATAAARLTPLARGLDLSYKEAERVRKRAEQAGKAIGNMLPYRFASAMDAESFHYRVLGRYMGRALDDDPRPWASPSTHAAAVNAVPFGVAAHPYNPDALLSKETAMAYTAAWAHELRLKLAWEQQTLDQYIPNAAPVPGNGDGSDDAAGATLFAALVDPATGAALHPDVAAPRWPFASVTYALDAGLALPEVLLSYVRLPFPIGALLAGNDAPTFLETVQMPIMMRVLDRLRRLEDEAAAADAGGPLSTAAAAATAYEMQSPTARLMNMRVQAVVNNAQTLDEIVADFEAPAGDPEATAAARPPLSAAALETRAKEEQANVVRSALGVLAGHYRRCAYTELSKKPVDLLPESSHTAMSLTELLYSAHDLEASGSPASMEFIMRLREATSRVGGATREAQHAIAACVDIFPAWQMERNVFLQERQRRQLQKAAMEYKQRAELAALQAECWREPEAVAARRLEALLAEHAQERRTVMERELESFDKTFRTTTVASEAFLAARDHMVKHYMKATGAQRLPTVMDARPYRVFQQYLTDVLVSVEKVANANVPYAKRAYTSIFQAHRFKARRTEPALNYVTAGPSGAGKSFALLAAAFLAPPGVVENITTMTTASMNVDKDFDGTAYIQEEIDTAFLFTDQKSKDAGANDKANYMKARTTSFCTVTQYYFFNEETGQREPRKCYSSQHIVFLGATNQDLKHLDKAVERRLTFDLVGEDVLDSDGGKAAHMAEFEIFKRYAAEKNAQSVLRELHCAYIYVEKAIQAGAVDDVLEDGARIVLGNMLRYVHEERGVALPKTTKMHWILEAARTYAILDRCYFALFSEPAHVLYRRAEGAAEGGAADAAEAAAADAAAETDPAVKRWSWRMFQKLVEPGLYTGKEHVIDAVGAFDFLVAPRAEHQLLHTIATKVCKLGEPVTQWTFAHPLDADRGDKNARDYNYFALTGNSAEQIMQRLAELNKEHALMRTEDLGKILAPFYKLMRDTRPILDSWTGSGQGNSARTFTGLVYDPHGVPAPRAAMTFWQDPLAPMSNKSARQFVVSVDFILSYFGLTLDMTPAEMRQRLALTRPVLDAAPFAPRRGRTGGPVQPSAAALAAVSGLVECPSERAVLMEAARHCLSNRVLELSPYEVPGVAPLKREALVYHTFYTPDPVCLRFADSKTLTRVPMHGTSHVLRLERKRDGPLLWHNHYNRPLPSAALTIFDASASGAAPERRDETRGFYVNDYDVDFLMARRRQQQSGDAGLRAFEALAVRSWAASSGATEAAVRAALPPMSATAPLPWTFGAFATRLAHQAAVEAGMDVHFLDYPAVAMVQRLSDTADRVTSVASGTMDAYSTYSELTDPLAAFWSARKRAAAPGTGTDDADADAEAAPAPPKRRRVVLDPDQDFMEVS